MEYRFSNTCLRYPFRNFKVCHTPAYCLVRRVDPHRPSYSPRQIGYQGLRGSTARNHRTINGRIVAMISTHVHPRANAHRPLRRIESAGRLRGLRMRNAVAAQEPPGANDWTEPTFQIGDNEPAELLISQRKITKHRNRNEILADGRIIRRNGIHDAEIIYGAASGTRQNQNWLGDRRSVGGVVKTADAT